ncbi:MAG: hypothetical protein ACO1NO_05760 [Burkholderiaceae bacterium]
MGQAKNRGSLEQRIEQARQKTAASTPDHIVCNHCKTDIADVQQLDTKGLRGIEAAFAGQCPACSQSTYAVKGEPKSVAAFMDAMQRATGSEAILGSQAIKRDK